MKLSNSEITKLWDVLYPKVYGYFYKRVSHFSDVEDLASSSLTVFFDKLNSEDYKIVNEYALLWKICYNQFLVFIKQKSKIPVSINTEDLSESFVIQEDFLSSETEEKIQKIFEYAKEKFPKSDYEIFYSAYIEGKNATKIADETNIKSATVRKKLSRIIQNIKSNLQIIIK